jgi:restriction system protein
MIWIGFSSSGICWGLKDKFIVAYYTAKMPWRLGGKPESGWRDSNSRPLRSERSTLPTALHPVIIKALYHSHDTMGNMLPKHKYLLTYRYAEIICDLTVEFCTTFLSNLSSLSDLRTIPQRRTIDQMVQAARSGKQNIIEGVGQGRTSKKGEIKLLGVANASFEELTADYEDFLRQRKLSIWSKTDVRVGAIRKRAFFLTSLSNLSDLGNLLIKPKLPQNPERAANTILTLCHQVTYLLGKQIGRMEELFVEQGGYTEELFKKRLKERNKKLL